MDLYPLFDTLEQTAIGETIRESLWLFPVIEAVHLLGLATLGGAILIVDLRLMGLGLIAQPASRLERAARPWLLAAIAVLIVTGVMIGLSEALKLYDRQAFWVKMIGLALALGFTFAVKIPLVSKDKAQGVTAGLIGFISLALWLVVAGAGRWIGFS